MGAFSYLQSIFTLDTIDTRFTHSASTPHRTVGDTRSGPVGLISKKDGSVRAAPVRTDSSGRPLAQPSKWNTPEFYLYYLVFIVTVPAMFYVPYYVSRRE
jgi:hypothetical protein